MPSHPSDRQGWISLKGEACFRSFLFDNIDLHCGRPFKNNMWDCLARYKYILTIFCRKVAQLQAFFSIAHFRLLTLGCSRQEVAPICSPSTSNLGKDEFVRECECF